MPTSQRSSGALLAAGAATFATYVLTHPRGAPDEAHTVKEAVHSMAVESPWVPSHLLGLAAVVLIAASLWLALRSGWLADSRPARRAAWLLLAGAVGAGIELVPHTLVSSETSELATGGSTPLTDVHLVLQAILLPVYGVGVAALAVAGFQRIAHPAAAVLGVVGGIALAVVGPLLLITDEPALGRIFMPGAGTFLFLFAVGVRLIRGEARHPALATS